MSAIHQLMVCTPCRSECSSSRQCFIWSRPSCLITPDEWGACCSKQGTVPLAETMLPRGSCPRGFTLWLHPPHKGSIKLSTLDRGWWPLGFHTMSTSASWTSWPHGMHSLFLNRSAAWKDVAASTIDNAMWRAFLSSWRYLRSQWTSSALAFSYLTGMVVSWQTGHSSMRLFPPDLLMHLLAPAF